MKKNYDVVVIGAGSGGLTCAVGFAKVGKSVLLVEKEHMGGECTNSGCVPSKALLHHAKSFHSAVQISGKTKENEAYRNDALLYVQKKIEEILLHETPEAFRAEGIDVILGEAEFIAQKSIKVEDAIFTYKKAIIATGSSPREMEIPGIYKNDVLTNQNLFTLETIPKRLLIIGAGPIGMEMGQAFAMLGSKVTIADINDRFARLEDKAISPIAQKVFEDLGITIHLNASIQEVENKQALFDVQAGDGKAVARQERVAYDKILFAIGRTPNMPKGLSETNITSNEHGIVVDSQYKTTNKHVFAIGDVSQRLKFTHTADDAARQIVTYVASKGFLRANRNKAVPKVTYTEPEIAQVGLSYAAAIQKYNEKEIMRIEVPFTENDRAKTDENTSGLLVVYARRLNGAVLSANIIGPRAGELISIFTLAIDNKLSMWRLQKTIYAYPTYALIIKKAGDYFFAQQIKDLQKDLSHLLKKHILKIAIAIVWAIALWQLYAYKNTHGMNSTETALMLFDFITMTIWGPLLYVLIYVIRPLTFFPATALTILSGIFFGFWEGTLLTLLGANLSAVVAYGTGRFFSKGFSLKDSFIGNWVAKLRENTFSAILTMRLIFMPFDGVSYLAGVLKTGFLSFVIATCLGTVLGSATFVSIGASLDVETFRQEGFTTDIINTQFLLLSAGIFIVSLALSAVLKRQKK